MEFKDSTLKHKKGNQWAFSWATQTSILSQVLLRYIFELPPHM
jgi:hypothetical protein